MSVLMHDLRDKIAKARHIAEGVSAKSMRKVKEVQSNKPLDPFCKILDSRINGIKRPKMCPIVRATHIWSVNSEYH